MNISTEDRFMRHVVWNGEPDECWLWNGVGAPYGYFRVGSNLDGSRRQVNAHRWVYEFFVGPIPPGLEIDHLCRVHGCVNPAHLEPVTQRVNTLRGVSPAARNSRKTHCIHGHRFRDGQTGHRRCHVCDREAKRRRRASGGRA